MHYTVLYSYFVKTSVIKFIEVDSPILPEKENNKRFVANKFCDNNKPNCSNYKGNLAFYPKWAHLNNEKPVTGSRFRRRRNHWFGTKMWCSHDWNYHISFSGNAFLACCQVFSSFLDDKIKLSHWISTVKTISIIEYRSDTTNII